MSENVQEKENLSPRQQIAVQALLTARTMGEVAEAAGIAQKTLTRWLRDERFSEAVKAAQSEALSHATRLLVGEQKASINTLAELRDNKRTPASVRRGAARDLLELSQRFVDLRDFDERLARLEGLQHEQA